MPEFLNILLQKSDPYLSWGFDIIGGREYGLPLTISEVSSNSFSSQYLSKGDEIMRIEGVDASLFTETEALSFFQKPSKSLDLVIYKRSKENTIHNANRAVNEFTENNSHRRYPGRELNLKSNSQCYFAVPEKKLTRPEKKKIYKRSSSVPPPLNPYQDFHDSSLNAPYTEFDPPSEPLVSCDRRRNQFNSVRDRSASPPFWRNTQTHRRTDRSDSKNSKKFWRQLQSGTSDVECDHEVARYCRTSRWHTRSSSVDSNFECDSSESSTSLVANRTKHKTQIPREYKYRIPVHFDYYEHKERKSRLEQHQRSQTQPKNISTVYLSPYDYQMQNNIIKSLQPLRAGFRRQTSQSSDKGPEVQTSCENVSPQVPTTTNKPTPPAPAPPPPPPPTMNGCIPTIRLKSEIPEHCEPPAKLQNAMMKDKKPFTYTPGGIDLSEIKSPRMQRRIVRNAQTPDDVILPPTNTVHTNTLPPSAVAAMTPQIAIPVFPQNGIPRKASPNPPPPPKQSPAPSPVPQKPQVSNSPPPPPQKQQIPRTMVINTSTKEQPDESKERPRTQVGSLYVPPVVSEPQQNGKPAFPTLREAPTPWLQKHQQPQEESKPAWVNRNKNNGETEQKQDKQVIYERKPRVQQVQVENETVEPEKPVAGTRVIPIQLEGSTQTANQPNSRQNSQRWANDAGNQTVLANNKNNLNRGVVNSSKSFTEPDSKPIQSRSFKVLQKITGSEDDTTDFSSEVPYNTEGLPLSQLRKLQLCDDDQAFMNKVKSQANGSKGPTVSIVEIKNNHYDFDVDEDIFLHTETDPRYRGSAIPSKAFRMLQNMTESGQVIPTNIEVQNHPKPKTTGTRENENEPQKKYIPPSERQAEQEFRKYMGSSIPSRSFRMLQAMTATQDTTSKIIERTDNVGEETHLLGLPFYPNPWPNPPKTSEEINLFWIHYMYLFNLVLEHLPHRIDPGIGDFTQGYSLVLNNPEIEITSTDDETRSTFVSNGLVDEYSESECRLDCGNAAVTNPKEELIITELIKDDTENDVSLTVCIPLRRKSVPIEYHEEVTIKGIETSTSKATDGSPDRSSENNGSLLNDSKPRDSRSPNSTQSHTSLSDTEHSESSSVDFWKEMADDDDMFYKHRPVTPFERPQTPDESESEYDHIEDLEEDSKNKTPADADIPDAWRSGDSYTSTDTEDNAANASGDHIDDQSRTDNQSQTNDSSEDSSDENDSYNMYEFSYTLKPPDEPIAQPHLVEDPIQQYSEAEEDSGMTSDVGKYPSEVEPATTELRKLSKYQRANTHSRLLRILLDEEKRHDKTDLTVRKESLTLPLSNTAPFAESVSSSSGINSPMSPVVNEKLVCELVQSLLKCNNRLGIPKLSPEKLRQAAIKSLQAEASDSAATSDAGSPYSSDITKDTRDSEDTDINYSDYYDSWHEHSVLYPGFDILPSRAFKILQSGRSTPTNWPKCPLVSNQSSPRSLPKFNTPQDASYDR